MHNYLYSQWCNRSGFTRTCTEWEHYDSPINFNVRYFHVAICTTSKVNVSIGNESQVLWFTSISGSSTNTVTAYILGIGK